VLVEAITDPDVPPLPPHITPKQARGYLMSMVKGDPHAFKVMKASVKELFA
jgi:pyruvate dehydrogenase (quinone)